MKRWTKTSFATIANDQHIKDDMSDNGVNVEDAIVKDSCEPSRFVGGVTNAATGELLVELSKTKSLATEGHIIHKEREGLTHYFIKWLDFIRYWK